MQGGCEDDVYLKTHGTATQETQPTRLAEQVGFVSPSCFLNLSFIKNCLRPMIEKASSSINN